MRSDQRQEELRRLGNQLPVLGKANSLCKIVKVCVFCLFVNMRLSPGRAYRARDKDIPGKIRVESRRTLYYSTSCAPWRWKNTDSCFLRFFVRSVTLFLLSDVDTYAFAIIRCTVHCVTKCYYFLVNVHQVEASGV